MPPQSCMKISYTFFSFIYHSTIFLFFFSHPLTCTNHTILMDDILYVLIPSLFVFSMPCVVYSRYTTQQTYHRAKVLELPHVISPYTTFLVTLCSSQKHISETIEIFQCLCCRFIRYLGSWGHVITSMGFHVLLGCTFLGLHSNQKQIRRTGVLLLWRRYTFFGLHSDQD